MSEPTPPRRPEPEQPATGREETRPFAAPVPPQQPGWPPPEATGADGAAAAHPATVAPAGQAPARRGKVLMGAAAAGLLGVGVLVGVVVGQATAGSAAADPTSATTQTLPNGGEGGPQFGTPPDGRLGGGHGDFGSQLPGGTDGGTDGGGTTDDSTT